ncbi:MAG: UDP-N-acetylmuramoyl-tripeptide--D-alanyl-D-alanine ligase, partial [Sphingobacteriales bacterium]
NFNGGGFAEKAIEQGAKYAVIQKPISSNHPQVMVVDDTLLCLQQLAKKHRETWTHPVLAITGSNGKTTCKELISSVLSKKHQVHATPGNFNNHIGLPLTILNAPKQHNFTILEMGASKPGDIQELCEIGSPQYGVITNIGAAHLEGFGSLDGVLQTKTELFRFIEAKETATGVFCNSDFPELKSTLCLGNFSKQYSGDYKSTLISGFPFLKIALSNNDQTIEINTQLTGKYNLANINLATLIGQYFDVDLRAIKNAIEAYIPSNNRSQLINKDGKTYILDAYNANPNSVMAALDNLLESVKGNKGSVLAFLGEMGELGADSQALHQQIISHLEAQNIPAYCIGVEFTKCTTHNALIHLKTSYDPIELMELVKKSDTILIKGSRSTKMEEKIKAVVPGLF